MRNEAGIFYITPIRKYSTIGFTVLQSMVVVWYQYHQPPSKYVVQNHQFWLLDAKQAKFRSRLWHPSVHPPVRQNLGASMMTAFSKPHFFATQSALHENSAGKKGPPNQQSVVPSVFSVETRPFPSINWFVSPKMSSSASKTPNPVAKALEPFVCGGSAATFASIIIHPIDLAKVRMQLYGAMNPGKPVPSFPTIISNMVQRDGVLSVYKGVDAAIGRQMVYGTARIGLHRLFSDTLRERNQGKPISFLQKTLSGMASGAIAVCIGTPFDIALVRLQADGMAAPADRRNYRNVFDALIRTTKEEGVGALYKGLAPNILRGMSMVSVYI